MDRLDGDPPCHVTAVDGFGLGPPTAAPVGVAEAEEDGAGRKLPEEQVGRRSRSSSYPRRQEV